MQLTGEDLRKVLNDNLEAVMYEVDYNYKYGMTPQQAHHYVEGLRNLDAEYQKKAEEKLKRKKEIENAYFRNLIQNVRFSGNRTIVFWSDGTKTVAKCADKDVYDKEKGLMAAICKRFYGNKCILPDMIEKWCKDEVE